MYRNKPVESYLFESDKERVIGLVMEMGQKAVSALKSAVDAFISCDCDLGGKIIEEDNGIDLMDGEIDLECLRSIAARQPVRDDLRFIFAVLKTTTDLERVGDHAVNIARQTASLGKRAGTNADPMLAEMRDVASSMLSDVLIAFQTSDGGASEEICRRDDRLDVIYEELTLKLIDFAASRKTEDPETARVIFAQMMVARYLERVGDHCTNIAERVYFMDKGESMPGA